MRLLYVCSDFGVPPCGTKGASAHLRAITRALAEIGHEVLLLSPKEGPDGDHPAQRLLPAGCPPVNKSAKMLKRWMLERGFGDALARELRPLLYNAWVRERALTALAGAPPDAIVERLTLLGHAGVDLAEALDAPLIVEVNALLAEEARAFRSLQLEELARLIERRVLQRADAVLVVSAALAERLAAIGISRQKVQVVPNGAHVAAFQAVPPRHVCRAALGLDSEFVVGFAGSLKVWHGVDVLLAAFGRLLAEQPTARLLIVGSGPAESTLRETAGRMGIERSVTLTGAVPHDQVPRLLRAMDVAVAPFKAMDDFYFSPIKLFEYMAAGLCVVASRLGQIQEVIEDHGNGLLCAPNDVDSLLAALRAAGRSAELRRRLGVAALETVRERYTWNHAAQATARVVRAAVERRYLGRAAGVGRLSQRSPPLEV
ncbi:MAG: glycosyltransferase family 4 protein [Phycisphaerae bacterium]